MSSLRNILTNFRKSLQQRIGDTSTRADYDPGPDGWVFSPELRERATDAITAAVEYVMENIVSRHQPTSRRGRGHDGGSSRTAGSTFNVD